MNTPAIALQGVHKSFGKVHAVNGLDLTVQPGEVVAFLGPNGAGKTTTIDMMLGLSQPDSGSVTLLGMKPREAICRGLVSSVMQSGGLLADLTVLETVAYMASLFSYTRPTEEVLKRAGIWDIRDHRVVKCSGGQQQRIRFALALLPDPAVIMLDEPTTGMDVAGRRDFWNAIREDTRSGRTVLFATHYLEEADEYADRIVLIAHGQVVADGSAAQIKAMASGRTVRATLTSTNQEQITQNLQQIHAMEGVTDVEIRGSQISIHTNDSDPVARYLLTAMPARDVEISSHNLEDAFVKLTQGAQK